MLCATFSYRERRRARRRQARVGGTRGVEGRDFPDGTLVGRLDCNAGPGFGISYRAGKRSGATRAWRCSGSWGMAAGITSGLRAGEAGLGQRWGQLGAVRHFGPYVLWKWPGWSKIS